VCVFLADSSAAKSTEKNKEEESAQAVAEDNSNEIHSCCKAPLPGSVAIPAVAMIQPQQKLPSHEHMDETLAVTSAGKQTGQQSSIDFSASETISVSSTHQTAAKTATTTTAAAVPNTITNITTTTTTTTTTEIMGIKGKYFTSDKLHEFWSTRFCSGGHR
jgi:hypothetical protein